MERNHQVELDELAVDPAALRVRPGLVAGMVLIGLATVALWQATRANGDDRPAREPAVQQGHIAAPAPRVSAASPEAAGRYLILAGGCNDCHTPGFAPSDGKVPEEDWLTGVPVGFRGPWGTTYPSNLRLFVKDLREDDFVAIAHNRNSRPPMVWPSLRAMSDDDLRGVYRYLKLLGPKGTPTPDFVPPGEEPKTPYIDMTPKAPGK